MLIEEVYDNIMGIHQIEVLSCLFLEGLIFQHYFLFSQ